jgi:hypothetical protein
VVAFVVSELDVFDVSVVVLWFAGALSVGKVIVLVSTPIPVLKTVIFPIEDDVVGETVVVIVIVEAPLGVIVVVVEAEASRDAEV